MPTDVETVGCLSDWKTARSHPQRFIRTSPPALLRRVTRTVIAVDIPIGYPAPPALERAADNAARDMVGERRSSVFTALHPKVLWAPNNAAAHDKWFELTGHRVNPLSLSLAPKIREVEAVATQNPRVYEVHPEVSFRALADRSRAFADRSLAANSQWNGHTKRRALLAEAGIVIPDHLEQAGSAGPDDVLDATVAAWSAGRIDAGVANSLPNPPELDANGRQVAIWY